MPEPIPNLHPPVCPLCKGNHIVLEERSITIRQVAGFNDEGELEYLPDEESYGTDDNFLCRDCHLEFSLGELSDATFLDEEGRDDA